MDVQMIKIIIIVQCIWLAELSTPCPPAKDIFPCFCTSISDGSGYNIMICPQVANATFLSEYTESMKGSVIDRFLILNSFTPELNGTRGGERLPNDWLAPLRVRELEIHNSPLSSCFLCNEPIIGQEHFLTMLVITNCGLKGHLCSSCNFGRVSISTRELVKAEKLKTIDFSSNDIEFVNSYAFPHSLRDLRKVVLSKNDIKEIQENAFSNLPLLSELDLSYNKLKTVPRRMLRMLDQTLRALDLSFNSIAFLPKDMFTNMLALKELKVGFNHLETLPVDTWLKIPPSVDRIDVKGNFLMCNCSISWVARHFSKVSKLNGKCVTPFEMESQDLKSASASLADKCSSRN